MKEYPAVWVLCLALLGAAAATPSDDHVKVLIDKNTNFSALHTYAWTRGWASFDPQVDAHIVAAVDRELASLGVIRQETMPVDMVVSYGTVQRSDVDVSAKRGRNSGLYPEYPVGTLVVLIREPSSRRELLRARAELPIDIGVPQLEDRIDAIVARIFAHYPTRASDRP